MQTVINYKTLGGKEQQIYVVVNHEDRTFRISLDTVIYPYIHGKLEECVLSVLNAAYVRSWPGNPQLWIDIAASLKEN